MIDTVFKSSMVVLLAGLGPDCNAVSLTEQGTFIIIFLSVRSFTVSYFGTLNILDSFPSIS